ncbi:MAG: hypothetical protein ACOYB0_09745 [Polynucleobacter sp.]
MSKGINIAEECHVAAGLYPIAVSGLTTMDAVNMEGYSHFTAIITTGATNGAAITVTAYNSTDASATSAGLIAFNYYLETTASTDVLGARTLNSTTALAFTNDSISNQMAVIEIDASELEDGHNWVNLTLSGGVSTTPFSIVYILSGARYAGPESPTVIA